MRLFSLMFLFLALSRTAAADVSHHDFCLQELQLEHEIHAVTEYLKFEKSWLLIKFPDVPEAQLGFITPIDETAAQVFAELLASLFFNESSIGSIIRYQDRDWLSVTVHQGTEDIYGCYTYLFIDLTTISEK